jgi:hypothetical protein
MANAVHIQIADIERKKDLKMVSKIGDSREASHIPHTVLAGGRSPVLRLSTQAYFQREGN